LLFKVDKRLITVDSIKPDLDFECILYLLITLKIILMRDVLSVIAVILIVGWLLGFFMFHAGGLIHLLLVIALICIVVRLVQGRRVL